MDLGIRVELVRYTEDGERLVAAASKVSLSRKTVEDIFSIGDDEVEEWILETFRRQHFSPWEHSTYTFVIDGLSRVASHQLVRHRMASYTQLSHRYSEGYLRAMALEACRRVDMECPTSPKEDVDGKREAHRKYSSALRSYANRYGLSVILASSVGEPEVRPLVELASIAYVIPPHFDHQSKAETALRYIYDTASYYLLLSQGARREDARYVLPGALRTRVVVTMNARELIQVFIPLRTCTRAQWELRHIAWRMLEKLREVHPRLFRWAGPSCVLRENTLRRAPASLDDYIEGRAGFAQERCPELVDRGAIPGCLKAAMGVASNV